MTISVIFRHVEYHDDEIVSEPEIYDRRVIYTGVEDYDYEEALRLIMKEAALNEYILNIRLHYENPYDLDDLKPDEPISTGEYITLRMEGK